MLVTMAIISSTLLPQVRLLYSIMFCLFASVFVHSPCTAGSATLVAQLPEIPRNQSSLSSFAGLSGTSYSFRDSYPTSEVIRHVYNEGAIIANDTESYTFKCQVIHPVLHPQVHYRILLKDNSTLIFAGGRRKNTEIDHRLTMATNATASWEAEYEFNVHFTTNMTRGECLGMDVYKGTWREDGLYLHYAYARVPTLQDATDQSNRTKLFTVGDNYRLKCPIGNHGFPWASVTWILPSGVEKPSYKFSDGELRVWPVQNSDGGKYTCVAKNKYGNVSYTFTVELRYPPVWEYLNIKWRRFREGCDFVYSIVMMMLAHNRWF